VAIDEELPSRLPALATIFRACGVIPTHRTENASAWRISCLEDVDLDQTGTLAEAIFAFPGGGDPETLELPLPAGRL